MTSRQLSSYLLDFLQLRLGFLVVMLQISPVGTVVIIAPLGVLLLLEHGPEVHAAGVYKNIEGSKNITGEQNVFCTFNVLT